MIKVSIEPLFPKILALHFKSPAVLLYLAGCKMLQRQRPAAAQQHGAMFEEDIVSDFCRFNEAGVMINTAASKLSAAKYLCVSHTRMLSGHVEYFGHASCCVRGL